jgi:FkbM family methyltransferase
VKAYRWLRYAKTPRSASWQYGSSDVLQCCIAYNKYGGYCIPLELRHGTIARMLFSGESAEDDTIQYLMSHSRDGDIVHAGAFIGDFLPALSRACGAGGRVWAFEPAREHYRCAAITLQINGIDNVELANAALGERAGEAKVLTADANGPLSGGSRIVTSAGDSETVETVRTVSVDDSVPPERRVSVIHLDVEGFEQQALQGAMRTIARDRPVIVVETLPSESWLQHHLRPLGYEISGTVDANTVLKPGGKVARGSTT